MNKQLRIVVDTNIIGSALLGGRVADQFGTLIKETHRIDIVYDDQLIAEVRSLATIPYFRQKGINDADIDAFLNFYQSIAIKIMVTAQVRIGRDRKDHYLLSLCRDAHAHFLITGDHDLLTIGTYGPVIILTLSSFIDLLPELSPES